MLEQPLTRVYALQCLVLGWLLGDKAMRDRVQPSWFTDEEFRAALHNLREGAGYVSLERVLREHMNVEWTASPQSPLESVLAALKRDGEFSTHEEVLNRLIKETCDTTPEPRKDEFLGRIRCLEETIARIQWERDNPVEALKQKGLDGPYERRRAKGG